MGEAKEKSLLAREIAAHFVGFGTNDRLRDREHQRDLYRFSAGLNGERIDCMVTTKTFGGTPYVPGFSQVHRSCDLMFWMYLDVSVSTPPALK